MAKPNKSARLRQLDVQDLVELVGALSNIRNGGNGHVTPLTDPSVNVKELVELRADYEEKISNLDREWQRRFAIEQQRANVASSEKESVRLDAKIASVERSAEATTERLSAAAITLANTVTTTADAAQKAVQAAASTQSELVGQVRDTVSTLQTAVTSIIAAGGARQATQTEATGTQRYGSERLLQWVITLVGIVAAAGSIVYTVHAVTGK